MRTPPPAVPGIAEANSKPAEPGVARAVQADRVRRAAAGDEHRRRRRAPAASSPASRSTSASTPSSCDEQVRAEPDRLDREALVARPREQLLELVDRPRPREEARRPAGADRREARERNAFFDRRRSERIAAGLPAPAAAPARRSSASRHGPDRDRRPRAARPSRSSASTARRHTVEGAQGMGAHVTLLYPFADTTLLDAGRLAARQRRARRRSSRSTSRSRPPIRFPENPRVLCLRPEPDAAVPGDDGRARRRVPRASAVRRQVRRPDPARDRRDRRRRPARRRSSASSPRAADRRAGDGGDARSSCDDATCDVARPPRALPFL